MKSESRLKAARTAAKWSFNRSDTYAILERVSRLQQHVNALLADHQYAMIERLEQMRQQSADQKLKAAILHWLSPMQMNQTHQTVSDRVEKGSGTWLLESDHFKRWESYSPETLWCWGIPGAGKTVMASIIINHLRRTRLEHMKGSVGVAFIYLRFVRSLYRLSRNQALMPLEQIQRP